MRMILTLVGALTLALAAALPHEGARAEELEQGCPGFIALRESLIKPASLAQGEIGLTFIGHATFLIESPGGVRIATDYNDLVRPSMTPDVVTMNRAHSTHFTNQPDPGIRHVLRGWNPDGGPARHSLEVGDFRIRNVPTNIRSWGGDTLQDGNSIFVFETQDLCVAHLGHLHHTLTPQRLKDLGRVDVLLVPVDGGYTLDTAAMVEVLKSIGAPLMIPMHYFSTATLNRFLDQAREHWPVQFNERAAITVSRDTLPKQPTVLVLPGR